MILSVCVCACVCVCVCTFSEVYLAYSVALSESDRHHANQVGVHFLLCVFLPAHHECWIPTGRHQVFIKELVLRDCAHIHTHIHTHTHT